MAVGKHFRCCHHGSCDVDMAVISRDFPAATFLGIWLPDSDWRRSASGGGQSHLHQENQSTWCSWLLGSVLAGGSRFTFPPPGCQIWVGATEPCLIWDLSRQVPTGSGAFVPPREGKPLLSRPPAVQGDNATDHRVEWGPCSLLQTPDLQLVHEPIHSPLPPP